MPFGSEEEYTERARTTRESESSLSLFAHLLRDCSHILIPLESRKLMSSSNPNLASAEARLVQLKLELPPAPKPVGVYKPVVVVGNLAYASGHGPLRSDGTLMTGRVGADLDLEGGKRAARQVGLAMLASLRAQLGSLDRIRRVIKVLGLVNCTDNFGEQPKVINGFSELFAEIWGPDHGVGARSAVGTNTLPGNIAVEVEAIFELVS